MKKTRSFLLAAGVLLALAFTLSGCSNDQEDPLTSSKTSLAEKLKALKENAVSNTEYVFELTRDENIEAQRLYYSGKENITIRLTSSGGEKIISLTGNGSLFEVRESVTLILESGVTLLGHDSNDYPLIEVDFGTLIMNNGAKISGNTNANFWAYGGGVYVDHGTFTMEGGEISGNTATNGNGGGVYTYNFIIESGKISGNTAFSKGGGVFSDGTFTMKNGEISGNTATNGDGGGVYVYNFAMEDGEILGNTTSNSGGGVYISGTTATMEGGNISDNTASDNGGGVYTASEFKMDGGEISGNTTSNNGGGVYHSSWSNHIKKTGGTIYGDNGSKGNKTTEGLGNAVYSSYVSSIMLRNTTAGPEINLDSSKSGETGGWEN